MTSYLPMLSGPMFYDYHHLIIIRKVKCPETFSVAFECQKLIERWCQISRYEIFVRFGKHEKKKHQTLRERYGKIHFPGLDSFCDFSEMHAFGSGHFYFQKRFDRCRTPTSANGKCIRNTSYSQGFLVPRDPRLKTSDHCPNEARLNWGKNALHEKNLSQVQHYFSGYPCYYLQKY